MTVRQVFIPSPSWFGQIDRSGGPHACWPWTGPCMTNGYGQSRVRRDGMWRACGAHQLAYAMATGRWERRAEGRLIRHLCHNRLCCNPAHLRGGTPFDNACDRDALLRGESLLPRRVRPMCLPVVGIANRVCQ